MRSGLLAFVGFFLGLFSLASAQGTAPIIVTHPASVNAVIGDPVTLSVAAEGTAPIAFQWFKGDTAITGATNSSLSFFAVTLADAGFYRVQANNDFGTATSLYAYLYVGQRPQTITFTAPTASATASSITLNATASSGLPVTYNLVSGAATLNGNILTATSGSVVVRASQAGNDTYLAAEPVERTITFLTGSISPFITSPPLSQSVNVGASVTFRASAIGTPVPTFQWQKDGADIAGATSNVLAFTNVTLADAGRYSVSATNVAGISTASATLTVQIAPVITSQPENATVFAGSAASFSVVVTAVPAPTFQWRKNGTAISGATRDTLTLASADTRDAGRYDVVVTNSLGSVTSTPATLTVDVRDFTGTYFGRFDETGASGASGEFALLVHANRSAVFLARAPGNTTAVATNLTVDLSGAFTATVLTLGTTNVATPLRGTIDEVAGTVAGSLGSAATRLISFTGSRAASSGAAADRAGFYTGAVVGSAAARTFAIVAADGDTLLVVTNTNGVDSARATLTTAGRFVARGGTGTGIDVVVNNGALRGSLSAAGAGSAPLLAALDTLAGTERLANVSVRTITSNAAPLISGFVIVGTGSKQVLIRAAGPALAAAPFNVAGTLNDPTLQVFRGRISVAQNDDWDTPAANRNAVNSATTETGAFPFRTGSNDAAIATSLAPAAYTAQIGGGTGIVLAEVYENLASNEQPGARRLVNVSARGLVSPGAPLIAGFVIHGTAPLRVLVRGIGATLGAAPFNVGGVLANPQLTLFRGTTALKSNDDWFRDADAALIRDAAARAGAFALGGQSVDASVLIYLEPGVYTAQVSGPNNAAGNAGTGIALVEVYDAR